MGWFILVILSLFIYLLPSIIAHKRGIKEIRTVFLINIFLWWIIIGWLVALIMALDYESNMKKESK